MFYNPTPGVAVRPFVCVDGAATLLRPFGPSTEFASGMFAWSAAQGLFAFDPTSLDADDGATVIKPDDIAVGDPGRWKKVAIGGAIEPLVFRLDGPYGGSGIGPGGVQKYVAFDAFLPVLTARTISNVTLWRRSAGLSGQTQIEIRINGGPLFTAPNRPVVLAGAGDYASNSSSTFIPGAEVLAPGDIVEARLTEIETADPNKWPEGPEGLCVIIEF